MTRAVRFRGLAGRTGPLTWGQRWSWDIVQELVPNEHRLNLWLRVPVEGGHSVDECIAVLATMVARHETLRTIYRLDSRGEPEQVVHGAGEIPVEVRSAQPDTAVEVADRLKDDLLSARFDMEHEMPIRLGLVTCDGTVTSLIMTMFNLVLDGWSMSRFRGEVRMRLAAREPDGAAVQPLDLAAWERTSQGRAVGQAGYEYWREQLAAIAAATGPAWKRAGELPRYWYGEFSSVALSRAVHAIAARLRVAPSAVLLAGLATILGLLTGRSADGLFLVVSNRYRPAMQSALGRFMQSTPMLVDLRHRTFDEVVRSTAGRILRASRFGQADPRRVANLVHGPGVHRGAHLGLPIVFDYHHQERPARPDQRVDIGALRRSAMRSTFTWQKTLDEENMRWYVQVYRCAQIGFWIDTRYLSRVDLLSLVFGAERLLIEATAGDVALADLTTVTGVTGAGAQWRPASAGRSTT